LSLALSQVAKCSTRELPLVVSKGVHGATTVASTARLAAAAGIKVNNGLAGASE